MARTPHSRDSNSTPNLICNQARLARFLIKLTTTNPRTARVPASQHFRAVAFSPDWNENTGKRAHPGPHGNIQSVDEKTRYATRGQHEHWGTGES
jgi:hypothetical protein